MYSLCKRSAPVVFALFALIVSEAPAAAQGPGVRAGVSVDPDQFYFGGHYETGELIEYLHLRPNVELGLGDDVTTLSVNIEAIYKFPLRTRRDTTFYAGGGPAINFYDFDNGSDTQAGLNLLGGLAPLRALFMREGLRTGSGFASLFGGLGK